MSSYCGDIRLGDTIDIKFTTRAFATGAPTTLSSSPVISAYPSNSVTQLTAGITLTVDFDSVTGYNNVRVVASSGNGYATATNYDLCITTGTVGGVSVVGESIGSFSIENRSALMPTTAGRTLVVDAAGLGDANTVKLGPTGSGTAQTARDLGASVLLSAGSGAGQLDFTSGVVKANLAQILGTALTETAGLLAGGFKKFFNISSPAATMDHGVLVDTATNLTNAPTAGDFTATMKASITTAAQSGLATAPANWSALGISAGGAINETALVDTVTTVTGLTASNLDTTVSSRATPAQVATQVDTVINTNTKAELGGVPAANASLGDKLCFVEMKIRNAETQTATNATIANSAGTPIGTAAVSDDGTTFSRGKYA